MPSLRPAIRRTGARHPIERLTVASLTLALLLVLGAAPEPLASGPRPPTSLHVSTTADRWAPPAPHVDATFATLPFADPNGVPGTWAVASDSLPVQMVVEADVAERFGVEAVTEALTVWNDTPGSTFAVEVAGLSEQGVDRKLRDGVSRIFLDRRDCGGRFLARAHLYPGEVQTRDGRSVAWVTEVDIGVCERLTPGLLAPVLRHEVAHVAGLGHLCDTGSECWLPQMGSENRCRLMNPAAYPCQALTDGDEAGLAHLHPRLPRVAGQDRTGTAAAVSYLRFPRPRSQERVVVTPVDAPTELQAAAAVLATAEGVPHLLVDEDCTHGSDGEELNRVARVGATAVLVGPVGTACRNDLQIGWELETEDLRDVRAVTDAVVERTGPPRRLVLTTRPDTPDEQRGVPDVALAVPAATALQAPLLTTDADRLDGLVTDVLDAFPSITGVVVVGDTRAVSRAVTDGLAERGLRVRRLDATDRVEVGLKLSRMRDAFGSGPQPSVLVAADRSGDAIAAGTLAAALGAPVIPVFTGPASPDVRVSDYLARRTSRGFVVGGAASISVGMHVRINRAVDGVR